MISEVKNLIAENGYHTLKIKSTYTEIFKEILNEILLQLTNPNKTNAQNILTELDFVINELAEKIHPEAKEDIYAIRQICKDVLNQILKNSASSTPTESTVNT